MSSFSQILKEEDKESVCQYGKSEIQAKNTKLNVQYSNAEICAGSVADCYS